MRKAGVAALALLLLVASFGCYGPQMVSRSLDDWANKGYQDIPWLYGNTLSLGVLGLAYGVSWAVDGFVNAYYFWVKDAQPFGTGKGTGFPKQRPVPSPK